MQDLSKPAPVSAKPKFTPAALLSGLGLCGALLLSGPSYAQQTQDGAAASDQSANAETQPSLQEVVVTGTHIQRADAETAENVQMISAADIQNSGQETVADYLRTISSTFGNSINESFSNSFAPGAAMVGLRGLSGTDTLVLLNGRRITNYGLFQNLSDSFVDLNVIPLSAIDHIEILKSGGSAIYGSDAIAGVINIILKQNTTEKAVELGGRATTDGGGDARDANIRGGIGDFDTDGYNVFATASVYKRDQLLFSQRENTDTQNYTGLPDGILQYHIANQYTTPQTPFATCGTRAAPGVSTTGVDGPGCYYNDANQLPLLPEAERANFTATGDARINDNWTAYGDLFFSNEQTISSFTPQSLTAGSFVLNPATGGASAVSNVLPATNPAALGGAATPILYAFQSVGPRNNETVSNTYRITLGAKGTVGGWSLDGGYGHSSDDVSYVGQNAINASVLTTEIANGSFNFLNPSLTPAANNALRTQYTFGSTASLDTFDFRASGGLFDLPGGPMKTAVGTEFRHESVNDQPGAAAAEGLVLSQGVTKVVASRNVYAVFGEFDFPFIKSFDADLAGRMEQYSDVGTNVRPQLTLRWQPLRQITARAVLGSGFRAPSLAEASRSTSLANNTVNDPLDPEHRAFEAVGYITGGNPNVKPEYSKNLDLGLVLSPVRSVDLSVDYYSLYLYRVIAPNATAQQIIDDPSAYPGELVRSPNGTVVYAESLYTNQFQIHTSGLDVDGGYTVPLAIGGNFRFAADATWVQHFMVNQDGQWSEFVGTNAWDYLSPISGGGPVPRWKGQLSAEWTNDDWSAGATLRHTNGYQNALTSLGITTQKDVASFDAVDLNLEYRGLRHLKLDLSVVNLFNRYPPYDSAALLFFPTGTPYDPITYDDLGRMIDLHAAYSF